MNLRELSEHLGLSQTTVSRALNGYPEVSEKTRLRVQEAAKSQNYSPNMRAKSLATGRTMAIGHVIPFSSQHEMVNVVFSDFLLGASEIYAREGFDIRLTMVEESQQAEAYARLAETGAVDGVMVHGPVRDDPRIRTLRKLGLPFVVHGRSRDAASPFAWMDVDNERAFERATAFLLDLDHQRIGLVNGIETMDFAQRRRIGFEKALAAQGITADTTLMRSEEMTEPYGYAATCEMLEHDNPPTAIIALSLIHI